MKIEDIDIGRADGYVFDFGGVISVSPMPKWDRTLYPYCESVGLDRRFVKDGFQKYRRLWDGDHISFRAMYDRIFADAGLPPPDDEVISGIELVYKPDPAIYRICEERMKLPPARLLFFDDFPKNVAGARALGWQSVVYV